MSDNEAGSTENEDSDSEENGSPSLSSKELIYPTLDTVLHLVESKKFHFSIPQDDSIVFSNMDTALSFIFKFIQFQDFLQSEEIITLLQGMWISECDGSYVQLNNINLDLYPLENQSCLKPRNKALGITPIKFSPKSHFLFKFKENVSFQMLLLKIIEEQLQNGEKPTFDDVHQLAKGNGYRTSFYIQDYIDAKDFKRIAFFLLNCPFLNVKNQKIISLNDLAIKKAEIKKDDISDTIYSILLQNDPLRKGIKVHDLKIMINDEIDEKEIKRIIKKDHRIFNYHGFVGIKPKITDFNKIEFDESNSHNISALKIKNSKALQQPNLTNAVFAELYKNQPPFTIESFCSRIEGTEFYDQKKLVTVSKEDFEVIEKILSNLPNAIFEDNNIYPVPLECEIDIFGGLYLNAYENIVENNELLRIQTSDQNVSFLFELTRNQYPDYVDPAIEKPDIEYTKVYSKKIRKVKDENKSSSDNEEESKKKKKSKEEKKKKYKSDGDDDASDENESSDESSEESQSEDEEEDTTDSDDDDQSYSRSYKRKAKNKKNKKKKKKNKKKKKMVRPSVIQNRGSKKTIDNIDLGQSNEEMKKVHEIHFISHFFKDIKGTDQEPSPYKPPDMKDSEYLIYKAMIDRCGVRNKHKRYFFCRNIAAYLEGEKINDHVMDDSDESAKVIFNEISQSKFFINLKSEFSFIPQEENVRRDIPAFKTFRDMFYGIVEMLHKETKATKPIFTIEETADKMIGVQFYSKSLRDTIPFNKEYKYIQPFISISKTDDAFYYDSENKTFGLRKYCTDFTPVETSKQPAPPPPPVVVKKKRGRKRKEELLAQKTGAESDTDDDIDNNNNDDNKEKSEETRQLDINDIIKASGAIDIDKIREKREKKEKKKEKKEKEKEKREEEEEERKRKEEERKREEKSKRKEEKLKKKEEKLRKKDEKLKKKKKRKAEEDSVEEERSERTRKKSSKHINNALLNLKKTRAILNEPIRNKNISRTNSNSSNIGSDDNMKNDYDSDYYNDDDESNDEYQSSPEREDDYSPWPNPSLRNTEISTKSTFQDLIKEAKRINVKDDNKPFPSYLNFTPNNDDHDRENLANRLMAIQKTEIFSDNKFKLDDQIPELMEEYGKGCTSEEFNQKIFFDLGSNQAKEFDKSLQ